MNTYRVRPGFAHWHKDDKGLREFQGGETLQLTEAEAKGLFDKLEFVEEVPVEEPKVEDPKTGKKSTKADA